MEDSDELFDVHFYGVNIHLEMKQLIGTIGVYDLKRRLEDEIGYPVGRIRLVYKGKIMTDDSRLLDYSKYLDILKMQTGFK
ncbi:hypothetical protein AX774_g4924 [Zancudomyces culisetae]|uniref:Ubiquitin-like domain-containing protein n=1 Tax=Zancudomyces culisetae TaxID=1213189 RepID=A0A1R1PKV8_ZANCU|nr:hypothetical protein AX774_g6583 [Zancudomyces culisetae]OMH81611.1 hypothetical protein AX774_g4924 [Zancudomyces culisetae]|eukprot:OMH79993.1 hypothetical protein AX774_g6583 [Zancudomyces culisetae]